MSRTAKTPDVEVLSVSPHGIWLFVLGKEHLLRYDQHPWFVDAKVSDIFDVRLLHAHHLRWPSLDVDLHVDSLADPARFALLSRRRRSGARGRKR